ncbi:unnamed protein product [Staurois parvus]|uniref:Uncharacterized protein n=1 Tax=Staurois parvus TaxID=386267 RepID=A0ABN9G485_9NEOB|nr:unnamed protein product [Staurois parvus]
MELSFSGILSPVCFLFWCYKQKKMIFSNFCHKKYPKILS